METECRSWYTTFHAYIVAVYPLMYVYIYSQVFRTWPLVHLTPSGLVKVRMLRVSDLPSRIHFPSNGAGRQGSIRICTRVCPARQMRAAVPVLYLRRVYPL